MEFIKQKESTVETLLGENQDYVYTAEVTRSDGEVSQITMSIDRKEENGTRRIGNVTLRNGHQTCGIPVDEPMAVHAAVFDNFMSVLE